MNAFVAVVLLAAADLDCYHAHTMTDVRLCNEASRAAEMAVQDAYEQAVRDRDNQGDAQDKLIAEQREWQAKRRDECGKTANRWGQGSIRDHYFLACMKERAESRAKELNPSAAEGDKAKQDANPPPVSDKPSSD